MVNFPENEITVPDIYVSEEFIEGIKAAFSRDDLSNISSFDDFNPVTARNRIRQISLARKTLLLLLSDPLMYGLNRLNTVVSEMAKGNFKNALTELKNFLSEDSGAPSLDFGAAFNSSPVDYFVWDIVDATHRPPIREKDPGTIPAYVGPEPSEAPGQRVVAWQNFLTKGTEYSFQTDLLNAEINIGLRQFNEALSIYDNLMLATLAGSPRHKFVAIRAAFTHLALGDQLFRKQRVQSDQDRQIINDHYEKAVQLLQEKDVALDNPLRQQVEAHAGQQKAKLQNNLNYLGLYDAFVPNQRFTMLQQAAKEQIDLAKLSVQEFRNFMQLADAEKEKLLDLQVQRNLELITLDISKKQRAISTLSIEKIDEQLSNIDNQERALATETVINHFKAIIESAAIGAKLGPEGAPVAAISSVVGVVGNIVNFFDQDEQLRHQKRMAQIDRQIAECQTTIGSLESRISELRIDFYGQKLAFLQGKLLNADRLYELASLNEKRAVRQVETAIFLAYLFERALTFNLGEVDIRNIQFDYLDRPQGILDAVAALEQDFSLVEQELTNLKQLSFFEEIISLRETYPIQFSHFLATGEMDFVYSLYQLSKTGPATHRCRLREVGVEVRGLVPVTGFRGTLTHNGRFSVRDREATLSDPTVTRFVPTEEQLAQALEEQRRNGLAAAMVGGVLFYSLEPKSIELSEKTQFVTPNPPSIITLDLFEGIGPTGLWNLEIINHGSLFISDILIHFAVVSRPSDTFLLEPKVKTLIRSFESELAQGDLLDKVSPIFLQQSFQDVFSALQSGTANLVLSEENFARGITNLRFKALIMQAVDKNMNGLAGIGVNISRPDVAFSLTFITQADGFSQDINTAPPMLPWENQFPILGTWQLQLNDQAQFANIGEIKLFFVYSFEEV